MDDQRNCIVIKRSAPIWVSKVLDYGPDLFKASNSPEVGEYGHARVYKDADGLLYIDQGYSHRKCVDQINRGPKVQIMRKQKKTLETQRKPGSFSLSPREKKFYEMLEGKAMNRSSDN